MDRYYKSETGSDMADVATKWKPCNATTLQGAKGEATKHGTMLDHQVHVGIESGRIAKETSQPEIMTIATRSSLHPGGTWYDVD